MISKENYDYLREHYGDVASWAIWKAAGDTPKSNMGDLSVFAVPDLLDQLNPNVVFVGLNATLSIVFRKFIPKLNRLANSYRAEHFPSRMLQHNACH